MASTHVFSDKATEFIRLIAGLEDHTVESMSANPDIQKFMDQFCPAKASAKKKTPKAKKASPPRDPSEISPSKCQCRVWNKGDGGQCRGNPEKDSIMCKRHAAEALRLYEESTPEDDRGDLSSTELAALLCQKCEEGGALGWMGIVTDPRPSKPTDKKGKKLVWADERTSKKKSAEKPKPKADKAKPKADKAKPKAEKPKPKAKVKKAEPEKPVEVPDVVEKEDTSEPIPESPTQDNTPEKVEDDRTTLPPAEDDVGNLEDFDLDDSDDDDDVDDWPVIECEGVHYRWNESGDKMLIGVKNGKTIGTLESEDADIDFLNDAAKQAHADAVSEL